MKKSNKVLLSIAIVAIILGIFAFFLIGNRARDREMPEANGQTGEILSDIVIIQNFKNTTDNIEELAIVFSRAYDLGEDTDIVIELLNDGNVIMSKRINADDIQANHRTYVKSNSAISGLVGKELTLKVYTTSTAGTGLFLMVNSNEKSSYIYGEQTFDGTICFSLTGKK